MGGSTLMHVSVCTCAHVIALTHTADHKSARGQSTKHETVDNGLIRLG